MLKISDDAGTCGELALQSCQEFYKTYTGARAIYKDYVAARIGRANIQKSIDVLKDVLVLETQGEEIKSEWHSTKSFCMERNETEARPHRAVREPTC